MDRSKRIMEENLGNLEKNSNHKLYVLENDVDQEVKIYMLM